MKTHSPFEAAVDFAARLVNPFRLPTCRFVPSCSEYAKGCVREHGVRAIPLILNRLWRCRPWGSWGYDPVPARAPRKD